MVSNPPYVAERARVDVEVSRHEPPIAVYGGPRGGEVIERLVTAAAAAGARRIALEMGEGQADEVAALLTAAGFTDVRVTPDLAGIPRVAQGTRP